MRQENTTYFTVRKIERNENQRKQKTQLRTACCSEKQFHSQRDGFARNHRTVVTRFGERNPFQRAKLAASNRTLKRFITLASSLSRTSYPRASTRLAATTSQKRTVHWVGFLKELSPNKYVFNLSELSTEHFRQADQCKISITLIKLSLLDTKLRKRRQVSPPGVLLQNLEAMAFNAYQKLIPISKVHSTSTTIVMHPKR